MDREIGCECGFVARGDKSTELVDRARAHARTVHHMHFSVHQLLPLVRPAADEFQAVAITEDRETSNERQVPLCASLRSRTIGPL
jgi:hypothetical protein